MLKSDPAGHSFLRSIFSVGLSALLISSCGLGMDTQDRLHRGQQAFSDGEYRAAVIDAKNVLLDEPDNLTARLLLGWSTAELGNNQSWNCIKTGDFRAIEVVRRAYANQPEKSAVVDTLGWILVKKGALQDGIAMLRHATEMDQDRPEVRYHLAAALVAAGDTEEAKSVLQETLTTEVEFASRKEAEDLLLRL